jgi:hypothetical protein
MRYVIYTPEGPTPAHFDELEAAVTFIVENTPAGESRLVLDDGDVVAVLDPVKGLSRKDSHEHEQRSIGRRSCAWCD